MCRTGTAVCCKCCVSGTKTVCRTPWFANIMILITCKKAVTSNQNRVVAILRIANSIQPVQEERSLGDSRSRSKQSPLLSMRSARAVA